MVYKVIGCHPNLTTVLTQHLLLPSCILYWQLAALTCNQAVKHLEVHAHVSNAFAADGACVGVASILCKTAAVQEVSTGQLLDGGGRIKEVLMANRTVALHGPFPASKHNHKQPQMRYAHLLNTTAAG